MAETRDARLVTLDEAKAAVEALREMLDSLIETARLECQAQSESQNCPVCPREWDCSFATDVARWRAALAALAGEKGEYDGQDTA